MEIIPAIIPESFEDLKAKLFLFKGLVPAVQIDVTDGIFVPSKSWPFNDDAWSCGVHMEPSFMDEINFEFDLMVSNPEGCLQDLIDIGAKRIIVHVESSKKLEEIIESLKNKVEVGIAFNIETPFELYDHLLEKVDFVQLMGIEKIGFQGQEFSKKVIDKIKELKKRKSDIIISVDGGADLKNASALIEAGATRLVSGSAILKSDNIKKTIEQFKEL